MGSLLPPPPVHGNDCDVCEPTLWPNGATPKFVSAEFKDVQPESGIPSIPALVTGVIQQTSQPCKFFTEYDKMSGVPYGYVGWWIEWDAAYSSLWLARGRYDGPTWYTDYLFWGTENPCVLDYPDNNYQQGDYEGYGGTGKVVL